MTNQKSSSINVVVAGVWGRMGQTILKLIASDEKFFLSGALERPESDLLGETTDQIINTSHDDAEITSNAESVMGTDTVLVDFTRPEATRSFLETAWETGSDLVIGTTGLTDDDHNLIDEVSNDVAVLQSPNMSVGINTLLSLLTQATDALGDSYDIEITEMHHRHKEDAPSGTAKLLAEQIAEARGQELDECAKYGREGFEGERSSDEIGIFSLRGGDVAGDHTVIYADEGERVEFTHKASSRETFAKGALRAAEFVRERDAGRYDMQDALDLK